MLIFLRSTWFHMNQLFYLLCVTQVLILEFTSYLLTLTACFRTACLNMLLGMLVICHSPFSFIAPLTQICGHIHTYIYICIFTRRTHVRHFVLFSSLPLRFLISHCIAYAPTTGCHMHTYIHIYIYDWLLRTAAGQQQLSLYMQQYGFMFTHSHFRTGTRTHAHQLIGTCLHTYRCECVRNGRRTCQQNDGYNVLWVLSKCLNVPQKQPLLCMLFMIRIGCLACWLVAGGCRGTCMHAHVRHATPLIVKTHICLNAPARSRIVVGDFIKLRVVVILRPAPYLPPPLDSILLHSWDAMKALAARYYLFAVVVVFVIWYKFAFLCPIYYLLEVSILFSTVNVNTLDLCNKYLIYTTTNIRCFRLWFLLKHMYVHISFIALA